jgi:serine/threonine protein kinase
MHAAGIVHRDIKPESLILTNFGKASEHNFVKLVGYSDCMFYNGKSDDESKCGTIGFTAPEVLSKKIRDHKI